MASFYPLTVSQIRATTSDALVLTLEPSGAAESLFSFIQGQYLTFRKVINGQEVRRSYSICSGVQESVLQVAVKRVEHGIFSNYIHDTLQTGDVLEALPPMGRFFCPLDKAKKEITWLLQGVVG